MTTAPPIGQAPAVHTAQVLPAVRCAVRDVLLATPAFQQLPEQDRTRLAGQMVAIGQTAAARVLEERRSDAALAQQAEAASTPGAAPGGPAPLVEAQAAGDAYSGVSAQRVAGTTREILDAVSFPRCVTELLNGVFKAITESNMQQMNAFVELIGNVAATLDGFSETNMGPDRARQWLVERFPGSYELVGETPQKDEFEGFGDEDDGASSLQVRLRAGAKPPSDDALRAALTLEPGESVPSGDPDRALVPLVQRQLARTRQQMLATMVQMGMQRIVIDSGRLNASMRFHIDTRSAAAEDRGNRFDLQHTSTAKGNFGMGAWGASASISNTIGYVSTSQVQTTEEMNTELDLDSSVELNFHTDYLPLDRMATGTQQQRIQQNSLNPQAEAAAARKAREDRTSAARKAEQDRRANLQKQLQPSAAPPPAPNAAPGTSKPTSGDKGDASNKPTSETTKPAGDKKAAESPKPTETKKADAKKTAPAGEK